MSTKAAISARQDRNTAFHAAMVGVSWGFRPVRDTIGAFCETVRVEVAPAIPAYQFIQVGVPVLLLPNNVGSTLPEHETCLLKW